VENQLQVQVRKNPRATVVMVCGELDLASSATLEEALAEAEGSDLEPLILDLRKVDFMDSSGLAVVVKSHQRAQKAGRPFAVVNGSSQVQRLLSVTGVDDRIIVVEDPEQLLGGG
jgi:anti-anti-sigma factor